MAESTSVGSITDFRDLPVFNATCYAMIFVATKTPPPKTAKARVLEVASLNPPYPDVKAMMEAASDVPQGTLTEVSWNFPSEIMQSTIAAMRSGSVELRD